jgi:hypothetical protein
MGDPTSSPPVFHEDHTGDRIRYGFRSRPPGYGTCPEGFIIGSQGNLDIYPYGTIDYPRMLAWEEVNRYSLVLDGMRLTQESVNWFKDEAQGHWDLTPQMSDVFLNWQQLKANGEVGNNYLLIIPDTADEIDGLFPVIVIPQVVL